MTTAFALLVAVVLTSPPASADPRDQWYADGLAQEAIGTTSAAALAFRSYLRAAEGGLPEAQFNVAVMLDSGRGTVRNVGAAALWYGRAAAHGFARAAYNLGQLYDAGDGVPRNPGLARAWYAASRLPAAIDRVQIVSQEAPAPAPAAPVAGPTLSVRTCVLGCELVWTADPQPPDSRYLVEVRRTSGPSSLVFSASATTSSLLFVSAQPGPLMWRVSATDQRARAYAASPWRLLIPE